MRIRRYKEPKFPRLDERAGKQRFLGTADKPDERTTLVVDKDSGNPIDTRLRQLCMMIKPDIDFKKEFLQKWALVYIKKDMSLRIGRICDIYSTRDVRIKTRKKQDIVVPFEDVVKISTQEIV